MEAKLLPLLTQRRVPIPECNSDLVVGGEKFEVDFLWRRQRLVVETDGGKYHGHPVARRGTAAATGSSAPPPYRVHRLAWDDLEDRPRATMNELLRLLAAPTARSAVP